MTEPGSPDVPRAASAEEVDEWEYEYDETQTEDWYFTLDLTMHVPDAFVEKQHPDLRTPYPYSKGFGPNAATGDEPDVAADDTTNAKDPSPASSKIQILDLHTGNPLVKLDDDIYSCYWSTDLGTQFHVSEAGVTSNPRRPGTVMDIVGSSQTRLLGKPVQVYPRDKSGNVVKPSNTGRPEIELGSGSDSEMESDEATKLPSDLQAAHGQPLKIPRTFCRDQNGHDQATFLERLSEIKLKKGENDILPLYSVRNYDPPDDADELRRESLAADVEQAKKMKDELLVVTGQRPRKRRRKLTRSEMGISLDSPHGRRTRAEMGIEHEAAQSGRVSAEDTMRTLGLQREEQVDQSARPDIGSMDAY